MRWSPEVEHERNVAVFDLLESNSSGSPTLPRPLPLVLSLREATWSSTSRARTGGHRGEVMLVASGRSAG